MAGHVLAVVAPAIYSLLCQCNGNWCNIMHKISVNNCPLAFNDFTEMVGDRCVVGLCACRMLTQISSAVWASQLTDHSLVIYLIQLPARRCLACSLWLLLVPDYSKKITVDF